MNLTAKLPKTPVQTEGGFRWAAPLLVGAVFVLLPPGCDLARPDPLPPRGDEHLVERARRRLSLKAPGGRADGRCKRKRKFYRDADKDGFGDPTEVVMGCTPPEGYVANSADCYDQNARARPDQKDHFHVHRGDGSFDYDCDGKATPRFTDRGYCRLKDAGNGCVHVSGWNGPKVPGCGNAAAWHWYACQEIHTPVLPEPRVSPPTGPGTGGAGGPSGTVPATPAPVAPPSADSPRPAPARGSSTGGPGGQSGPTPARGSSGGPGHSIEPVRPAPGPPGAATAVPKTPRPTVRPARRRRLPTPAPLAPSTRMIETRVRFRCAGRLTPWKKMQLCH